MQVARPKDYNVNKDKMRPNVEGIWWGRVCMCQLITPIFSHLGPPTNLLLPVTKDGDLDQHWFS